MLWKLLQDMKPEDKPTHLAVVFDKSEKTFRTEMYDQYKANRDAPPDDLIPQFALVREAVHAFEILCLEQAGFEADDLIATYARLACEAKARCSIVSSDKDLMQLVNDCVTMYDTMKDKRIGREEVIEKFGVPPEKVIEVQSLIGDTSDNVPGVPGIGVKTAAQLIGEYGDLETLLARAGEIKQEKRRQSLIDNADKAILSKKLVTLDQHVDLDVPVGDLAVHAPDYRNLIAFLKAMEFSTLTRRIAEIAEIDASSVAPAARLKSGEVAITSPKPEVEGPVKTHADEGLPLTGGSATPVVKANGQQPFTPAARAAANLAKERAKPVDRSKYETVRTLDRLKAWVARAHEVGIVAVDTETTSLDPMTAHLCGFSLAVDDNEACYVPIGHREGGSAGGDLFSPEPKLCKDQIPEDAALKEIKALLEHPGVLKIAQNLKFDWQIFKRRGIDVQPYDDTMLMSYVLDAGRGNHGMDPLAEKWLGHQTIHFEEVAGFAFF
jgi:DNA polymerase-1